MGPARARVPLGYPGRGWKSRVGEAGEGAAPPSCSPRHTQPEKTLRRPPVARACSGGRGVPGGQHSPARSSWPPPPGAPRQRRGLARGSVGPRRSQPPAPGPGALRRCPRSAFRHRTVRPLPPRRACAARAAPPPPARSAAARVKGEGPGPQHFSVGTTGRGGRVSTPCPSFQRPPPDALLEKKKKKSHPVRPPGSGAQNPHTHPQRGTSLGVGPKAPTPQVWEHIG